MITTTAPGKIILLGEHAVVYGQPALAVPLGALQTQCMVDFLPENGENTADSVLIEAPDIGLSTRLGLLLRDQPTHPLAAVIQATFRALGVSAPRPMRIHVTSSIPVASGLGSGAAVSVAMIRGIAEAYQHHLDNEQVNELAYEIEKLHHGTPSGVDNTVITHNRPVYFVREQPIQTLHARHPFTVVIADTGVAALTRESVGDVRKLWQADPARWEAVFEQVGELVRAARDIIESGETASLGPIMDTNHALLQEMTVSSPALDHLVVAAKKAGAEGAKLSGGGRGGNMIALVNPKKAEKVAAALKKAGATHVMISQVG